MTDGGQQLGKYRIIQELGAGGFATVFKAIDTTLDRQVALKILHPPLLTDRRFVQNFRQEARTLAALRHPQIITIYEVGEVDGRLFIAMDLAHGVSLAQSISRRGRIPWHETLALLRPVCEALDYAHRQNVVHRDLKPANLLLDTQRGAQLTDFGFARLMAENTASMTMSGGIVGTPGYIAPEVWESNAANAPVDIYALGCIVYEMLTGDVLFKGQTPIQAMRAHDRGPQLPATWADDVPASIATVLTKALARDPDDRYTSAGALWQALHQLDSQIQPAREVVQPATAPKQIAAPQAAEIRRVEIKQAEAKRSEAKQVEASRVEPEQLDTSNVHKSGFSAMNMALIQLAIVLDIAGGQLSKALLLPLWIDSLGTVLAGALLGPWVGAITGLLAHSIWGLLGLDQYALWFAPTAGVCGLLAGIAGRLGVFRRTSPRWLSALIGGVFVFALTLFVFMFINSTNNGGVRPILPVAEDLVAQNGLIFQMALGLGMVIGFFTLRGAGYAGVAGLITGVITAICSAPIAAYVFGGGGDIGAMIVAFNVTEQRIWAAIFGRGTVVDPFDKLTLFLIVYLLVQLLPQRFRQRFRNTRAAGVVGREPEFVE